MATHYRAISTSFEATSTLSRRRVARWRLQMVLVNFVEFAAESSRGIVMPTLFLYCQSVGGSLADMGLLTSVFSVGRLVSSCLFGIMCDRVGFRAVYLLSSTLGLLGNLVYVLADPHVGNSLIVLVVSRFLVGFGAGNRSVCRADVAKLTTVTQRLPYITALCMVVFFGYALTPGVGALLTGFDWSIAGLHIHPLTAPGVVLIVLNAITFVAMLCCYDETIDATDAPPEPTTMTTPAQDNTAVYDLPTRLVYLGVAVFMLLNVVGRGILSVFETINVPLYLQVTSAATATAAEQAATFQFNMGLLGLIAYVAIEVFRRSITDTMWLLIGLAAMLLGNGVLLVLAPLSFPEFAIGIFFIWSVGSPFVTAVSVAAFSKILGSRQQGTWMGILGSTASVSRIILPLLPALFSTFTPMFLINVIMCAMGIALLV
ncbi:hypothetical protein As57867_005971, partial [Aphanomyces stellatus]